MGVNMLNKFRILAAASLLAIAASTANAAPMNLNQETGGVRHDLVQIHGGHRSCERGPGGWHRHNRYGERRLCREWRGQGRRPDYCVRVGGVYICDY
jgi:hypothetical protein